VSAGTGKLKSAGGVSGAIKESMQRAFAYMQAHAGELNIGRELGVSDFHVEAIDLLANRAEIEVGVAFFTAMMSAIRSSPILPALIVLGDMSVQGNLKPVRSLAEPLQVAMDNGARRALIPIENKRTFLEVDASVVEHVDPVFFGDLRTAALKALGAS
jgi:ATP-dependent Lon protease